MRMRRILTVMAVTAVFSVVLAPSAKGETCVWTGAAGDGKWATPQNWQNETLPVSGRGDTVQVNGSGLSGSDMENDILGELDIQKIEFLGSSAVNLSGNTIFLSATPKNSILMTNECVVVLNVPLKVQSGSNHYLCFGTGVTFNGDVTGVGTDGIILYATYNTASKPPVKFYGNVTLPGDLYPFPKSNSPMYFYGTISAGKILGGTIGNNSGPFYCYKPLTYSTLQINYRHLHCCAENILVPDVPIVWEGYHQGGILCLDDENGNAYNQTCNWLGGVYDNKGHYPTGDQRSIKTSSPATLTVKATKSATTYAAVQDKASLCYAPDDSGLVQTFACRTNSTSGALIVSNGTLRIDLGSSWKNLSRIVVWPTGKLEITPTNGVANPFSASPMIVVAAGGKIKVPAGVAFSSSLFIYGSALSDATYSQNDGEGIHHLDCIEGEGTITVANTMAESAAIWMSSSGSWNDAANWNAMPSPSRPAFVYASGGVTSVNVDSDAGSSTNLTTEVFVGGRVAFDVSALWPFDRAWLNFGQDTSVTIRDGGELRYDGVEAGADGNVADGRILVKDGASISVENGGLLFVTNAQGRFVIGGGSSNSTGTVSVKAGGEFDFLPGKNNVVLDIEKGGLLDVKGTCRIFRRGKYTTEHLLMNGGAIDVSGDGCILLPNQIGADDGTVRFGTGRTTFQDNSYLMATGDIGNNMRIVVTPSAAGETAELVFDGSSCISNDLCKVVVGNTYDSSSAVDGTSRLIFKGSSRWKYKNSSTWGVRTLQVGYTVGTSLMELSSGINMKLAYYLLVSGYKDSSYSANVYGETRLSGASKIRFNSGNFCAYSRGMASSRSKPLTILYGLGTGVWIKEANAGGDRLAKGRLSLEDESSIDMYGHFITGAGRGEGTVVITGGRIDVNQDDSPRALNGAGAEEHYEYATNCVMAIGMHTGKGTYIQGGGATYSNVRTYIGGCETNQYFDGAYIPVAPGLIGQKTAEGLLSVTGGTFTATKEVYVGTDGSGTIEIGPAGTFTAETLVLSNQTESVLKFVYDANGFAGKMEVTNIVISAGTKLKVDLGEYDGLKTHQIITAANVEGDFAEEDVEITGKHAFKAVLVRKASGWAVGMSNGTVILLR